MTENHRGTAVAKIDDSTLPPCHSAQEQPDDTEAPKVAVEIEAHGDGDCCKTGHCDCAHASPATPAPAAAIELETFTTPPPLPKFAMLRAAALDIPLRPPAR